MPRLPSRLPRDTRRKRWRSARFHPARSAFLNRNRAVCRWTPWYSAWCRSRSGISTASTSDRLRIGLPDAGLRRRRRFQVGSNAMAESSSIGKFEIRREIGRGAMGVVYEGYDPSIKRVVALKTIRSDQLAGGDPAAVIARFRREAQAAGRLNHPNIVAIYDFGEDNGAWYIAMEFVQGRELKECFETNERFRTADIVRIMSQILSALDYSHRQGVIHRDIKPANIFLLPDGSVKVADFGIAHIDSSSLTQVGTVMGTP